MKVLFFIFISSLIFISVDAARNDLLIRARRQIITGQSAVATFGGGVAPIPPGSMVVDPLYPMPGFQTDPFRPSVVSVAGGGLMRIPPGSKIILG